MSEVIAWHEDLQKVCRRDAEAGRDDDDGDEWYPVLLAERLDEPRRGKGKLYHKAEWTTEMRARVTWHSLCLRTLRANLRNFLGGN
jgi:hypothetical protein